MELLTLLCRHSGGSDEVKAFEELCTFRVKLLPIRQLLVDRVVGLPSLFFAPNCSSVS